MQRYALSVLPHLNTAAEHWENKKKKKIVQYYGWKPQ